MQCAHDAAVATGIASALASWEKLLSLIGRGAQILCHVLTSASVTSLSLHWSLHAMILSFGATSYQCANVVAVATGTARSICLLSHC